MSGGELQSLPPSERKLQRARAEGRFGRSMDVGVAVSLVAVALYLIYAYTGIIAAFEALFAGAVQASEQGDSPLLFNALDRLGEAVATIALPLFTVGIAAVLLGAFLANRGLIFSVRPIVPDASRLSPGEGLRRLFSLRTLVMLVKTAVKALLLIGLLAAVLWAGARALLTVPRCGAECVGDGVVVLATPVIALALVLFALAAVIDIRLQDWLFNRDMRMTRSEAKREARENLGDPQIRTARKRSRVEDADRLATLHSHVPTALITDGRDRAVALRYVIGETPAPVIVGIGRGARGAGMIRSAEAQDIRRIEDAGLAADLLARGAVGTVIPRALLEPVARALNTRSSP